MTNLPKLTIGATYWYATAQNLEPRCATFTGRTGAQGRALMQWKDGIDSVPLAWIRASKEEVRAMLKEREG